MAVSSHLTEYYHVFNDGSTGRLAVTPWSRDTLADGYWMNENTIKPLSSRDVYLAECIETLSAKDPVYSAGSNVMIEQQADGTYIIAVDPNSTIKTKTYTVSSPLSLANTGDFYQINLNYGSGLTTADDGALKLDLSNIQQHINKTSSVSSYIIKDEQSYSYKYTTAANDLSFYFDNVIPTSIQSNEIYIVC